MVCCIREASINLSDEAGRVASQSTAVVVITPLGHDHERRQRILIRVHAVGADRWSERAHRGKEKTPLREQRGFWV
jgi:hypothetical protein